MIARLKLLFKGNKSCKHVENVKTICYKEE